MLNLVVTMLVIGFVVLVVIGHVELFRALLVRRPQGHAATAEAEAPDQGANRESACSWPEIETNSIPRSH